MQRACRVKSGGLLRFIAFASQFLRCLARCTFALSDAPSHRRTGHRHQRPLSTSRNLSPSDPSDGASGLAPSSSGTPSLAACEDPSWMAATSPDVWAAASKDYDALLFGAPRLVRFLTISGKEFLPSQGTFRPIVPETIELQRLLDAWHIDREGLVDLALLVGTDFNEGVKGIGPKKALKLVQRHGRIESLAQPFYHPPQTCR